jgi:hypothetical protein
LTPEDHRKASLYSSDEKGGNVTNRNFFPILGPAGEAGEFCLHFIKGRVCFGPTPPEIQPGDIFLMERLSPVGINGIADSVLFAACLPLEMKAPGEAANNPTDENEDLDGCCVQVDVRTSDEELPAAEGGVA